MPDSRGIRAGAAYVELFTDDSRLVRGLGNLGTLPTFSAVDPFARTAINPLASVHCVPDNSLSWCVMRVNIKTAAAVSRKFFIGCVTCCRNSFSA